jgi:hypothetical protein
MSQLNEIENIAEYISGLISVDYPILEEIKQNEVRRTDDRRLYAFLTQRHPKEIQCPCTRVQPARVFGSKALQQNLADR